MTLRRLHVLTIGAAIAMVLSMPVAQSASAADSADCSDFATDLYQLIKPSSGASLLTMSRTEVASAASFGFSDNKGAMAKVATGSGSGLVPVWRMYKSGDFVWATDGADADRFAADGYARQFVAFYAGSSDSDCVSPIQRLKKDGTHRMATTTVVSDLKKAGWEVENQAAFYATTGAESEVPDDPGSPGDGGSDTDTEFSIAVLPDTQNETSAGSTRFANRVSWLLDNEKALDLRYMIQVGDLTNWGNVEPAQFVKVSAELKRLEENIPWAGAIGNHDTAAVCSGGSACPGARASVTVRDTQAYNKYFPASRFADLSGTFESNKVDNAYRTFSAGGVDWLVLSMELWPRKDAVTWANSVVAANPDKNVVVVTHAYLDADGSISQSAGGYGATSPQYLYDNLIKVHPNIKIVLSGHVGTSAIRTDTGIKGNKIVSILSCYHSSSNPTRLLTIDTAAGTVDSTVYAPATNTSYPSDATSTSGLKYVR